MIAVIGDSENIGSVGVHASLGFHHIGTLKAVGHNSAAGWDAVYMQRALGPGDGTPPTA